MWFEILPAFGIITVALAVPGFAIYHIQNAWTGNPYRRNMDERFERTMYLRDMRVNGDVYKGNGLEAIKD
ncbi:unnamed protein product [Diamesa hyperborea]